MRLLLACLLLTSQLFAQQGRRLEILFLGDNGHHKPIERVPSLMAALGPKGINITYTDDLKDINGQNLNKYDALMIYANWDEITPEAERALLDYVASGKGILPIHCASYCFRNSAEYVKMVGGQFWRHTMDSITTKTLQAEHPIMKGLQPFTAYDETYLHSQLQADNNVLAEREIKADQKKIVLVLQQNPIHGHAVMEREKFFTQPMVMMNVHGINQDFNHLFIMQFYGR